MKTFVANAFFILFVVSFTVDAREFREFTKIMQGRTPFVTKFSGLYFMATTHISESKHKVATYTSSDLQSWKFENFAIDSGNFPVWGKENYLSSPRIHRFGENYNLYYNNIPKNSTFHTAIGVATAPTPNGPYVDLGKPLWEEPGDSLFYPTIAHGKFNF